MERRTETVHKLRPNGSDGTLPPSFVLVRVSRPQSRPGKGHDWRDDGPVEFTTLTRSLTRHEVAELAADITSWLAFDGRD
jgi:hypothetical protein